MASLWSWITPLRHQLWTPYKQQDLRRNPTADMVIHWFVVSAVLLPSGVSLWRSGVTHRSLWYLSRY